MGYSCTCAHEHPFPYLENGWTNFAENCCVVRGPLAIHFPHDGDIFSSTRVTVYTNLSTSIHSRSFIAQRALTGFMFLQLLKTFLYVNQRSSSMRVALTSYQYFCQTPLGGSDLHFRNRAQISARSAFLDSTEATGSLQTWQKRSRQE